VQVHQSLFATMQRHGRVSIKDWFDYFSSMVVNRDDAVLQDFSKGLKNSGLTLKDTLSEEQ